MEYTERDRRIFGYFDGENQVFCDPLATFRRLLALTGGKPNDLQNLIVNTDLTPPDEALKKIVPTAEADYNQKVLEVIEAEQKLEQLIRDLFNMKPFDPKTGTGAMMADCLVVWSDFRRFINQKKTPRENGQMSSTPTAGPQTIAQTIPSGSA